MLNYSRSRTRKFLYQVLYASTFSKVEIEEFKESFYSGVFESNLDEEYLKNIVTKYAPKFKISDMDLSYVLPIFIWMTEVLYYPEEIPLKVSINEAVEISKVYWDDPAKKMVNGVLYNFSKDLEEITAESKTFNLEINNWIFKK